MTFVKRIQPRNSWNQGERPVDNVCLLGKLVHDVSCYRTSNWQMDHIYVVKECLQSWVLKLQKLKFFLCYFNEREGGSDATFAHELWGNKYGRNTCYIPSLATSTWKKAVRMPRMVQRLRGEENNLHIIWIISIIEVALITERKKNGRSNLCLQSSPDHYIL